MWSRSLWAVRSLVLSVKVHGLLVLYWYLCYPLPVVGGAVSLSVGDEVAGLLPMDSECPGCAEYCVLPEYCLVLKPNAISFADSAAALRGGLMAYTALHHQTRLETGAIVLVCSALEGERMIILQLCELLGAKVS